MKRLLTLLAILNLLSCQSKEERDHEKRINDSIISVSEKRTNDSLKDLENKGIELANKRKNTIDKLLPLFNIINEEFSNTPVKWYKPKGVPKFVNYNALYCYFEVENSVTKNLRLVLQYNADEWLFINSIQFSIDGKIYDFIPLNVKRDNGDGEIWEWIDDQIVNSDAPLVYALSKAKSAKMKLIGNEYSKIKVITASQLKTIKNAIDLYFAMGGSI